MNDELSVSGPEGGSSGLNALLRGELAAVNAYQRALRSTEGRAASDGVGIRRFASEHQRTVAALQVAVRQMGGIPASEAATSGAFALLQDTASIRDLLDGEEAGLRMYEATHEGLAGDAYRLVRLELIPRQRRHVAELTAILASISA
jgi:hypothetical protein